MHMHKCMSRSAEPPFYYSTWLCNDSIMAPKAKRKAQSPADFPKKKQKVGKSKVSPSNTTKVAFKTGQIVVPVQLSETTGSSVTSARKQTVQVGRSMHMCDCNYQYHVIFSIGKLINLIILSVSSIL